MRRIIVLSFLSLDGVMQAPGGPEEDTSGGFKYGGWTFPFFDEFAGSLMVEQMSRPFDLLLGRKTYEIFESYWPAHDDPADPIAAGINGATKYVATHSRLQSDWAGTAKVLEGDMDRTLRALKAQDGVDLHVHGSGHFIQTLLMHDLVDELWLKIFPVTLGKGKRLFAEGTIPAGFSLKRSQTSPLGVIIADFERGGEVKTGSF